MIKRLIRWLARAEIARLQAETAALMQQSWVNGMVVGRGIGQGEMLTHLRGDTSEPATTELIVRRAAGMVH